MLLSTYYGYTCYGSTYYGYTYYGHLRAGWQGRCPRRARWAVPVVPSRCDVDVDVDGSHPAILYSQW